jgi:hypothetical protein
MLNHIKVIPLNMRTVTRDTTFSHTLISFFPYFTVYSNVMLASLATLSASEETNKFHEIWYERNATRGHTPFILSTFVPCTEPRGSHMYQPASFNLSQHTSHQRYHTKNAFLKLLTKVRILHLS